MSQWNRRAEDLLDLAIELSFPASDPISVSNAFMAASRADPPRREQKRKISTPGRGQQGLKRTKRAADR